MSPLLLLIFAGLPPIADPEISSAVTEVVRSHGVVLDEQTVPALRRLGEAGDRSAFALLGELYMMSAGRDPDWSQSCDYSERAGDHSSALHNLATCYFLGRGRSRDLVRAFELYERASAMGFAKSHCALGNMLVSGMAGRRDASLGLELCRHAADAGALLRFLNIYGNMEGGSIRLALEAHGKGPLSVFESGAICNISVRRPASLRPPKRGRGEVIQCCFGQIVRQTTTSTTTRRRNSLGDPSLCERNRAVLPRA